MRRLFPGPLLVHVGLAVVLMAGISRAGLLPPPNSLEPGRLGIQIESSTLMPVGDPVFGLGFRLSLTPGALLKSGDFITVYDIPGTGPDVFTSINSPFGPWIASNSGLGPLNVGLPDDPAIKNVTFTYFGATPIDNALGTSGLFLGTFSVLLDLIPFSPVLPPILDKPLYYVSSTTNPNPLGPNPVIALGGTTPSIVPEPASLALVAAGLPIALLLRRRRRADASA